MKYCKYSWHISAIFCAIWEGTFLQYFLNISVPCGFFQNFLVFTDHLSDFLGFFFKFSKFLIKKMRSEEFWKIHICRIKFLSYLTRRVTSSYRGASTFNRIIWTDATIVARYEARAIVRCITLCIIANRSMQISATSAIVTDKVTGVQTARTRKSLNIFIFASVSLSKKQKR